MRSDDVSVGRDGVDTESLTPRAGPPDVIVAYGMLGAAVTAEHGRPVPLYVVPMFGYKSLKWLSAIRVENQVPLGSQSRTRIRSLA
jgi:DMSO/TMAO reductase YedYZ molybdopterin-dependent catalytic subunit